MAYITVVIDDVKQATATSVMVTYHWVAVDGENVASSSQEDEFGIGIISATINSNVITSAVNNASSHGVTIGILDRKILVGGLA